MNGGCAPPERHDAISGGTLAWISFQAGFALISSPRGTIQRSGNRVYLARGPSRLMVEPLAGCLVKGVMNQGTHLCN